MRRFLWALPLLASAPVMAQPVSVRLGLHDGFGRVVFEFPQPQSFTTERAGNAVVLHFPNGGSIPDADGSVRNVAAVTGGGGMATVTIRPGARLRMTRMGNRVVVDVLDPAPVRPVAPRAALARAEAKSATPPPLVPPAQPTAALQPAPPQLAPLQPDLPQHGAPTPLAEPPPAAPALLAAAPPLPMPPQARTATPSSDAVLAAPLGLAATIVDPPAGTQGSAAMLPFGPSVAAAAFRHGDEAWIVFDDRRPLDLAGLAGDPAFAGASVELLPSATVLRVKLPQPRSMKLERRPDGWSMIAVEAATAASAVMPVTKPSRMLFAVASPGTVVAVPDAETGRNLLVGTLVAAGPGVPVAIRVPEFTVVSSWQGIVIEPVSDRTSMHPVREGYAVETGATMSPSSETGTALADAAVLTRRFDFQPEPVVGLLRRLQAQVQDIGEAAPQARLAPRKAAAQTMLSLGLGAEAQSLLRVAVAEDPRAAADPDANGLAAIAALLSSRPQEAGGLDAAGLAGSDEITLWRAVRDSMAEEGSAKAAQAFAATAGLVMAYPTALRSRLLPIAAETMVEGGASKAADALLAALPDEPLLAFARAVRLQQKGDTAAALTLYDALSIGRDRLTSARASTRATMLRLSSGAISLATAAEALERGFEDWRGDARERDLRLQTAEIEAKAGHWRKAFAVMKETAELFPESGAAVAAHMTAMLSELLHGPASGTIAPLDLVTLAKENAGFIAKSESAGMALLLADKLVALDLPQRAAPVIEQLAEAAPPGPDRAALGARLATLRLGEGDAAGAGAALGTTQAADLPAALQEERDLLDARVHAQQHDIAGASAILSKAGTQAADELRAKVLGDSGDWHGAALALGDLASRTLPDSGPLDQGQQDLLLRLASAQSRAGDEVALRALGVRQAGRVPGARGVMFRLLTAAAVASVADLRRGGAEIAMAKALPTSLAAIGAR